MTGFNTAGTLMFIAAFGAGDGITYALGAPHDEGLLMMAAGPILTAIDLGYRGVKKAPLVSATGAGGTFLFVPVWLWGLFWTGLGAYYYYYAR